MKAIELDHVGPIERLTIPVPADGGVVVLHGSSGVGKTHAIQAVRALHDSAARKSLRASDGVPSGKIEGLGVTIRLGRSNTARGELVCESLDSGVDPSLLVDPGLKDPLAADSKRLATLVRLAGLKIDPSRWAAAIGATEEVIYHDLVDDDPVASADRIRRRLHEVALLRERLSESKGGEAATLQQSVADVECDVESSEVALSAVLDSATVALATLMQRRKSATEAAQSRAQAIERLEQAKAAAPDVELAEKEWKTADCESLHLIAEQRAQAAKVELISQELDRARMELEKLDAAVSEATRNVAAARERWELAERTRETIAKLRESIDAELPAAPPDEEIEAAALAKTEALAAVQRGEVVRRAKATRAKAHLLAAESERAALQAKTLRELARSTDGVLEQALIDAGFDTIKVYDGRLCVESDRGLEPVSELSTGERWELALDLAARGLPKGAILSVQQEGWQALDHDLRRKVAGMAKARGLVVVTAEVDAGEIRAEVLA